MAGAGKEVLVVYRKASEAEPYACAVEAVGLRPVLAEAKPGLKIGDCAGLVLTGGSDVNPVLYREPVDPKTQPPDDERDASESALIDEALSKDLPLLAICRGMQLLNVKLGGSLIQHLPTSEHHVVKTPEDKGKPAHSVVVETGTLLAEITNRESLQVNSRHHQAVAKLGNGLRVCARDPEDNTVEAVDLPGKRYVLAVQWHPENQAPNDPEQRRLFESFADAL